MLPLKFTYLIYKTLDLNFIPKGILVLYFLTPKQYECLSDRLYQ